MFFEGDLKKKRKEEWLQGKEETSELVVLLVYQQVSLASHGYDSIDISIEGDC